MLDLSISVLCLVIAAFLFYLMYKERSLITKNNNIYMGEGEVNKSEKNTISTLMLTCVIIIAILLFVLILFQTKDLYVNQTNTQTVMINSSSSVQEINKIDLNLATQEELMYLDGIGVSKANKIIAYREKHPFVNVSELLNVVGDTTYENIKDYVKIGGE
jgi:competence ComEA-like helix-hairpin-helix protein